MWEKHRALEKDNAKGSWKRLYLRRWEQEREVILEKISANRFESAVFPRWEQERKVIWEKIKANGSWKRLGKGMVRMLRAMGCSFECRYIPVALERALAWLHSLALANLWNVALEESKPK